VTNYWDSVPWYEEEDKLVGNTTTRTTIKTLYTDNGIVPVFQTNVWNLLTRPGYGYGAWLEVPPDLDPNITMADPEFRSRWVDHVRNISAEWEMEYYCLGNEVNSYHSWHSENAADFEANFPSLMAASYAAIKEASPDTKVVLTFRLLELYYHDNLDLLELFDGTMCDIMAFTSYPSRTGDYETPADLPDDYYTRIADHTGIMPLAIAELGWTTHAAFGGDEDEQAEFLTWFLDNTRDIPWEYVQWLELHDLRPEGSSTSHAQSVGLRRNDGTPKAAWDVWTATFNLTYSGDWELVPRGPIVIDGNDDFNLPNGVSAGTGTSTDPYIIKGWDVDGSDRSNAVIIKNVTAHYVFRDCIVHGTAGSAGTVGIHLENSTGGVFHDNTIRRCTTGIYLGGDTSDNLLYRNNMVYSNTLAYDAGSGNLFYSPTGDGNFWDDQYKLLIPPFDHDGVRWDQPYEIMGPSGSEDIYPFVHYIGYSPVPFEDLSPKNATTGDPFEMVITSSDLVSIWNVYIRYWLGDTIQTVDIPEFMGWRWLHTIDIPMDSDLEFGYILIFWDTNFNYPNYTFSNVTTVPVLDNDPPGLEEDLTASKVEIGEELTFEVDVADNDEVQEVWVEYWYGDGFPTNVSMTHFLANRWVHPITIETTPGPLNYIVHFVDPSGNWASTGTRSVDTGDVSAPVFGQNQTTDRSTTGSVITFSIEVTDDVGLAWVRVEFGDIYFVIYQNETMDGTDGVYTYEYTVPPTLVGTMFYRFHANDTSGNLASSDIGAIIIDDDDPPTVQVVKTLPTTVGTGEKYEVTVNALDNVDIWEVMVNMSLSDGEGVIHTRTQYLQDFGGSWSGFLIMDTDSVGTLTYSIIVEDLYGNSVTTEDHTSQLVDTIAPTTHFMVPITAKVGEEISATLDADDNIGIVDIRWEGLPFDADGLIANGTIDEPGTYEVRVTVVDAAGNEASEEFTIFVEDDVTVAQVLFQIAVILVLVVVGLVIMKWLYDKRLKDRGNDPELEEPPGE
jgi:parallel beta-helix repeat protein